MTIVTSIVACVYETISGYPRARSTIDGELLTLELLTIENQRDGLSPVGDGVERMFRVRFTATVFPRRTAVGATHMSLASIIERHQLALT